MATYLGFSTQNVCRPKSTNLPSGSAGGPGGIRQPIVFGKKFKLVDTDLVIQDLVNALNIRRGTKVGQPGYGTTIWEYIFEPNSPQTQQEIENEIRRIIADDPRLILNLLQLYPYENGILVELQVAVAPINEATVVRINLNINSETAFIV